MISSQLGGLNPIQIGEFHKNSRRTYKLIKRSYEQHTGLSIKDVKLLDFGCGWGRIVRLFLKDIVPEKIYGCDVDSDILKWCKSIPGNFAVSEIRPEKLPFSVDFDLIYAFSVFTHLGKETHIALLCRLWNFQLPDLSNP